MLRSHLRERPTAAKTRSAVFFSGIPKVLMTSCRTRENPQNWPKSLNCTDRKVGVPVSSGSHLCLDLSGSGFDPNSSGSGSMDFSYQAGIPLPHLSGVPSPDRVGFLTQNCRILISDPELQDPVF